MPTGTALGYIRLLFGGGTVAGLADAQLLDRFATSRDEAAFAALVERHGPMVLATCRGVSRDPHDAEDAFQAAFFVLARKARSLRGRDRLGGWLHRVSYRIAAEGRASADRRRRREREAAAMKAERGDDRGHGDDLAPILHEEIDRLPERHRAPVVLVYLEGLTYEEAASELRWTVPTLRTRLATARERLGARLTRRGVTGAGVAVAAALASRAAKAAVPSALARATVRAATGGSASAAVVALSRTALSTLPTTKLFLVASGISLALGAAWVAVRSERDKPSEPPAALAPEARAPRAILAPEAPDEPAQEPKADEVVVVRGRVVDPAGSPVAGAALLAARFNSLLRPWPEGTSGPDGRFAMRIPRPVYDGSTSHWAIQPPWITASADGFGVGAVVPAGPSGAPSELTIKLVEAGPPIEGRILDLEGRPIAGVLVQTDRLRVPEGGDLSPWVEQVKGQDVRGFGEGLKLVPTGLSTATGADGRFRLAGIGPERLAEIRISGPTIATAGLLAMTRPGPGITFVQSGLSGSKTIVVHPSRFEAIAAPTKPIEGVVRDKDTGRPIAGVTIRGSIFDESSLVWTREVDAVTDADGRYRLVGLAKGPAYRLFLEPGPGSPYVKATLKVPATSPALEPVKHDIVLKRGVVVRGRVTDKLTGKPAPGWVNAYTFADNPHIGEFPGYPESYEPYAYVREDGRFEVVALPGRGLLACRSDTSRYRGGNGAEAIRGYDPKFRGFNTLPRECGVANFHVIAEINFAPGTESATVDLQVDPGRSLRINVVDPEGKPIGETIARGVGDLFASDTTPQKSPEIEVKSLTSGRPRRVTVTHPGRKLVGSIYLKGDEAGPMTLKLQPWGEVIGRIVDEEGKPRPKLALSAGGRSRRPPEEVTVIPGGDIGGGLPVDKEGRFRVVGLVPGLFYGADAEDREVLHIGHLFREVTLKPGEVKDLGDLKVIPYKQDESP